MVVDERMLAGRAFHAIGSERKNACLPNSSLERGTNRSPRVTDTSCHVKQNEQPLYTA